MRFFVVLFCAMSFFAFSGMARAYYDDSVVIEIGDVLPPEVTESSSGDTGQGGAGTGSADPNAGNPAGGYSGNSGPGGSGGSGYGSNGSPVAPGTPSSGGTKDPVDTLFDILTIGGAVTEEGGQHTSTPATAGGGNSGGASGASGSSGGGIMINAAKLRETLRGKLSFKDLLNDHAARVRRGYYGASLSDRDIGLIAASTMLGDSNIDQVTFGATRFLIVYRSQGYILGFIPKSFPVHVDVNPQAAGLELRVTIGLPWYRFFLRRLFDSSALASEIDTIVAKEGVGQEGENAAQIRARLFDSISLLLKNKVGTIGLPTEN